MPLNDDVLREVQAVPIIEFKCATADLLSLIGAAQLGMSHTEFPSQSAYRLAIMIESIRAEMPPAIQEAIGLGYRQAKVQFVRQKDEVEK
ncbi:MAG TPA: hypothetical protein VGH74_01225 [Planctomycetaceae bacterium]